jgi:hypothetical protein
MQDDMIGVGSVTNGAQVTVPAVVVDWLRDAAYAEIGSPGEALITAASSRKREAHPEWFRGPAESLKEIFALLDAIGWAKSAPPVAVQIDLRENYCWALMRTLHSVAEFAEDDASEVVSGDVEQRGLTLVNDGEADDALWELIADTRAGIDEIAVEEGNGEGFVLDIAA